MNHGMTTTIEGKIDSNLPQAVVATCVVSSFSEKSMVVQIVLNCGTGVDVPEGYGNCHVIVLYVIVLCVCVCVQPSHPLLEMLVRWATNNS